MINHHSNQSIMEKLLEGLGPQPPCSAVSEILTTNVTITSKVLIANTNRNMFGYPFELET